MAAPATSAAVVLFRRTRDGLRIYWVKRAERLAFLGGFWAFPGGRVDAVDASGDTHDASRNDPVVNAAVRELAEETGVVLRPDALHRAGVSVTPEWSPVRFAATYFLAELPDGPNGNEPDVARSGGELVAGEWVRPADALAAWGRAERMAPPVVVTALRVLSQESDGDVATLAARLRAAQEGEAAARLWDLVPGVAIAMLRTPTLPPATHTNCYVVGAEDWIVVDPASPYAEEQAALDEALAGRPGRVREIWLTHHHVDHASGAAHLAARLGVPVAAHARTAELLRGRVEVSRLLADGDMAVLPGTTDCPERRLRAVFTPGHAPGHLCFLEETTGLLIAGDMVAGVGTILIEPSEGDMRQYLASLALMKTLSPRALLPAHGPTMLDPQGKLDEYVRHRLWREGRVVDALAARDGASAADLVPAVYEDVPAAVFPLAELSLIAHLVKLVADGRVREQAGRYVLATR